VNPVVIEHISERQELLPTLQSWLEAEWTAHYGPGGQGNAQRDLLAYSNRRGVPLGLVAFRHGKPCGFIALKGEPFPSHPHLAPWVGAGYVEPSLRNQGIGRELLLAVEEEARTLGYAHIYCATSASFSLLERGGWHLIDRVQHESQQASVYGKAL